MRLMPYLHSSGMMRKDSPYYDEFLADENHIDPESKSSPLDNHRLGRLLSFPSTWNFSKSKLDINRTKMSKTHNYEGMGRDIPSKAVASSIELQHQLSLTPISTSYFDNYLKEHVNTWTGLETTLRKSQPFDERWESYFSLDDYNTPRSPALESKSSSQDLATPNLSALSRNFASSNLSDLGLSKSPTNLQRNDAVKSRPRTPLLHKPNSQEIYKAFPSVTKQQQVYHQPARRVHKSWPLDLKSERPVRGRPDTAPSSFRSNRPSNLSTCTTLEDDSTYSSCSSETPLYMRCSTPKPSSPVTPTAANHVAGSPNSPTSPISLTSPNSTTQPPPGLIEFMSQQSFFFHDDDEESHNQEKSWIDLQRQKWQTLIFHRENTPSLDEPPRLVPKPKKKKKVSLGKSTKEGLLEIFGRKKAIVLDKDFTFEEITSCEKKIEEVIEVKACPKCEACLKRTGSSFQMMATCKCRADLCFGCLKDWDFCEGYCESP